MSANYRPPRGPLIPGGGWIVIVAAAVPLLLKSAKPLARSLGRGMMKVGRKLMDSVEGVATSPAQPSETGAKGAEAPHAEKPQPQTPKRKPTKPTSGKEPSAARPRSRKGPPKATDRT